MPHTLLLADDSPTVQRVMALTFAGEDIDVIAVSDGQQAIERLATDPPDIVLADVDMPAPDGYAVAAFIRSRPGLSHIPVVLLTGAGEVVDPRRAEGSGPFDVFEKPFDPQMVIRRVKQLLGRAQGSLDTTEMPVPAEVAAPVQSGAPAVSADVFFDRLGAAFEQLHSSAPPMAPSTPAVTIPEEVIEQIVARVLSHLSERVVRETARQIVPTVAERMVREEIEKIKKGG